MKKRFLFLLVFVGFIGIKPLLAQGALTGKIFDENAPLPGATIIVSNLENTGSTTDANGEFSFELPGGTHQVTISFVGYQETTVSVEIEESATTDLGAVVLVPDYQELGEIVVSGMYYSGEVQSVEMRRNSMAIMDVTSADAIGKLPDINAAEAVQRVPGVSIDRDRGEGRYVTVRGTPSQWSSTTIRGDRIPAAKTSGALLGNRTVPMDIMPSELIQTVQVIKAITPQYEGDAIGGTINYIPRTSPDRRTLQITAGLPYNERAADTFGHNGTIVYGDRMLNDRFGFLVLGTRNRRPYALDNVVVGYGNELHNVNVLDARNYQSVRTNRGFNAVADFRVSPQTEIFARAYFTDMVDNQRNRKTMHYFDGRQDNAVLRWSVIDFWFKNYGGETGINLELNENLRMNAKVAAYESWAGYQGPSPVDKDLRGFYYGNWVQHVEYGNLATIDGRQYKFLRGDEPETGYVGDHHENIQPHFIGTYNPDSYFLDRYTMSIRNVSESDRVGAIDFQYHALDRLIVKFGGKYRHKRSDYDYRYATWTYDRNAPPAYLTQWEREAFPADDWFPELNNTYDNLIFNYPAESSFHNPEGKPEVNQHITYQMQDATNSPYATGNYDGTEQVWAGYLMGEWQINNYLTLVPGFRYEATSLDISSYRFDDVSREVSPVDDKRSFPAFLPMAQAIYKPNEHLDIRAAITRTFARAAFNHLSPTTRINENTQVVVMGNPGLKPTFSWNYDLIASYYLNESSYLSGSVFYKNIKDLVYERQHEENRTINGETHLYLISQPVNSDDAFLYGVELSYNQRFTFLPGFWNGLGLNLNYTYTYSETTLEEREGEKTGLMNQSPNIFNATLFYEKSGFALRLAANYREAFLTTVRSNSGADRYQDDDFHLDLNISYSFPWNMTLFVDLNNLTNQPLRHYHGVSRRPENVEYYSFRGRAGITLSF